MCLQSQACVRREFRVVYSTMDGVESEARTRPVASSLPCRINETVLPQPPVDGVYACLDCKGEFRFEVRGMDEMFEQRDKDKRTNGEIIRHAPRTIS